MGNKASTRHDPPPPAHRHSPSCSTLSPSCQAAPCQSTSPASASTPVSLRAGEWHRRLESQFEQPYQAITSLLAHLSSSRAPRQWQPCPPRSPSCWDACYTLRHDKAARVDRLCENTVATRQPRPGFPEHSPQTNFILTNITDVWVRVDDGELRLLQDHLVPNCGHIIVVGGLWPRHVLVPVASC
jgi:hypothetical protein